MSSLRFSRGPLVLALVFGVIGAAILILPSFVSDLPFADNNALIAGVCGGLTLVMLAISLVVGGRGGQQEAEDNEDAVIPVGMQYGKEDNTPAPMTKDERKAAKAAEAKAKKEAAEQAKFEKKAAKESAKAAKKAKKNGASSDELTDDEWVTGIMTPGADEDESFPPMVTVPASDVYSQPDNQSLGDSDFNSEYQAAPEVDYSSVSNATDMPMYDAAPLDAPIVAVEDAAVESNEGDMTTSDNPEWAEAAYSDPEFLVPFAEGEAEAPAEETVLTGEDYELDMNEDDLAEAYSLIGGITDEPATEDASLAEDDTEVLEVAEDAVVESDETEETAADETVAETVAEEAESEDLSYLEGISDDTEAVVEVTDEADMSVEADEAKPEEPADGVSDAGDGFFVEEEVDGVDLLTPPLIVDLVEESSSTDVDEQEEHADTVEESPDEPVEDELVVVEEEPVVEETPEDRMERLAAEMETLVIAATNEARLMREKNRLEKERHDNEVARMNSAIEEAHGEIGRLADDLDESTRERSNVLDSQSILMQAELVASRTKLERDKAKSRLRQVRISLLSKDPIDQEMVAIVESALRDFDADEASEGTV